MIEFFKRLFRRSKPVIKVAMWMYLEKEYNLTPEKAKLAARVIKRLRGEDYGFEDALINTLEELGEDSKGYLNSDPRDKK